MPRGDYRKTIRDVLKRKNLTVTQLAEKIGQAGGKVAPTYLHQIVRGERHPSIRKGYDLLPLIVEVLPISEAEKEKLVYSALLQILGSILLEAQQFVERTGLKFTSDYPESLGEAFESMREKDEKPSYYKLQDFTGVTHTTFRTLKKGRIPDIKVFKRILGGLKRSYQFDTEKLAYLYVKEAINDRLLEYLDRYLNR